MKPSWRQAALATIALALTLSAAVTGCGGDPPVTDEVAGEYYGMDGHVLRLMAGSGELDLLDRHLSELEELDVSFVRANLDWLQLEPAAPTSGGHEYDFGTHDDWVGALARHGLRWYAIGVGTPEWAAEPASNAAGCGIFGPPARPEDFAAMMGAVADRYGSDGTFWEENPELPYLPVVDYEIWNEPNLGGFWCPGPDPAAYANLLAAASESVRAADPSARIVFGGLAPFEDTVTAAPGRGARTAYEEFLEAVSATRPDLAELIDVVGIHAYGVPAVVYEQLTSYRDVLDGLGLVDVPMSLNETGWTTQGTGGFDPVNEDQRAEYLQEVTERVATAGCGVTSFAPHTWVTEEEDPNDQAQWFGMANPETGEPYETALAYGSAVRSPPPADEDLDPLCVG